MPKQIITKRTMPVILSELDKWSGKITWDRFAQRVADVLGEPSISRHTLLSYPPIVEAYNDRKAALKEAAHEQKERDVTLEFAKQEIARLEAQVARLEKQNALYLEQFVRWQHNLHMMPGVDLDRLNQLMDKPLPPIDRRKL